MFTILLGIIGFIIVFIFGLMMGVKMMDYVQKSKEETPVEKLKNALLTLMLLTVKSDDFSKGLNLNYSGYNGDELPSLSGCSMENDCFTYIQKKEALRYTPFYTKQMEHKIEAVEKYLEKNLDTSEKVLEAFTTFLKTIEKSSEEKTPNATSADIIISIPAEPPVQDESEIVMEDVD
jgi:hypothetical protein